jgi:DNA modification methylase
MCGSGTTLRMALEAGHEVVGSDLDPLAILISRVNTTALIEDEAVGAAYRAVELALSLDAAKIELEWIDNDDETKKFIEFWFAKKQESELRRLVYVINCNFEEPQKSFLKIALSRIIITKEMSASLARDTSHSRPHRVATVNDYDVFKGFLRSAKILSQRVPKGNIPAASVERQDARQLSSLPDAQIDAVITSPPYLNAIDYMRGNKLSLVWLGYKISDLRSIRGTSIGAEKKPEAKADFNLIKKASQRLEFYGELHNRDRNMFDRYIYDLYLLMEEIFRVMKPQAKAVLVVGNSCLKEIFIKNTEAVKIAAEAAGLKFENEEERELPANKRYLPVFNKESESSLAKRMRTESILAFIKP